MEVIDNLAAVEELATLSPEIERLRRQYMQMVHLRQLDLLSGDELKPAKIQQLLYNCMFAREGPGIDYKFKSLKQIIELIEGSITDPDEDEVIEDLYSEFSALMSMGQNTTTPGGGVPTESVMIFSPPTPLTSSPAVLFRSSEMANVFSVSGGTGHKTWEASLHLGSFLCTESGRELTRDKTVLELGAGKGLVSYLCLSYLDARRAYPTDGDAQCIEKLTGNPGPAETWQPTQLLWDVGYGDDDPIPGLDEAASHNLDLILGADITFDKTLMPDLARTICYLLRSNIRARAFISATLRNIETFESFRAACGEEKLDLIAVDFGCPVTLSEQTGLFHTHDVPIRLVEVIDRSKRQ